MVLKLDQTNLLELPGSVGRLQYLQELGLSKNKLTDLPITLENCKSLTKLSLNGNNFRTIPGVVLKLKALEDLRRLDNPLLERSSIASHPHINSTLVKSSSKGPWNPNSLQSLAVGAVLSMTLTGQVDYWDKNLLPPRQLFQFKLSFVRLLQFSSVIGKSVSLFLLRPSSCRYCSLPTEPGSSRRFV